MCALVSHAQWRSWAYIKFILLYNNMKADTSPCPSCWGEGESKASRKLRSCMAKFREDFDEGCRGWLVLTDPINADSDALMKLLTTFLPIPPLEWSEKRPRLAEGQIKLWVVERLSFVVRKPFRADGKLSTFFLECINSRFVLFISIFLHLHRFEASVERRERKEKSPRRLLQLWNYFLEAEFSSFIALSADSPRSKWNFSSHFRLGRGKSSCASCFTHKKWRLGIFPTKVFAREMKSFELNN